MAQHALLERHRRIGITYGGHLSTKRTTDKTDVNSIGIAIGQQNALVTDEGIVG